MLKHKFSFKEMILIIVAAILALGIFYYQIIVKNYNEAKVTYDVSTLQDEQTILLAKAQKLKSMQEYLETHSDETYGEIAVYNNQANEISALNEIFENNIENVSITWTDPSVVDSIVRRNATISFKTTNYDLAKELIEDVTQLKYRCIITSMQVSTSNSENLSESSSITITLNVTFFETIEGATSTSGLTIEEE